MGFNISPINIEYITQSHKSIEGYPNRQNQRVMRDGQFHTEQRKHGINLIPKEIEVLEEEENPKIED